MVAAMEDDIFQGIGHVDTLTYQEMVQHPTVKTMAVSVCWIRFCLQHLLECAVLRCSPMLYMNFGDLFAQGQGAKMCGTYGD